jgi:hypothetical protein
MDIELQRLIAAARRLDARIAPTRRAEDRFVILSETDAVALATAVRNCQSPRSNPTRVMHLIGAWHGPKAHGLSARDTLALTALLNQAADDEDRERKLSRGQIPGALSPSEAVRFMRRFGKS